MRPTFFRNAVISFCLTSTSAPAALRAQQQPARPVPTAATPVAGTQTPVDMQQKAWDMLTRHMHAHKVDDRIAALNALSLLSENSRAQEMVRSTLLDNSADVDVRLAAIVAAGHMDKVATALHSSTGTGDAGMFHHDLETLLSNADPKLSFAAATALWGQQVHTGEDILLATASGKRVSDYSLMKRSSHSASRTLHDPEMLAKSTLQQGVGTVLPPLGMGLGLYHYVKGTPGNSPQVVAIAAVAHSNSPQVRDALLAATSSKNGNARIAAAEALSNFSGSDVESALAGLMKKGPTEQKLTAAAAWLRVTSAGTASPAKMQ